MAALRNGGPKSSTEEPISPPLYVTSNSSGVPPVAEDESVCSGPARRLVTLTARSLINVLTYLLTSGGSSHFIAHYGSMKCITFSEAHKCTGKGFFYIT